jgi:hypothetical protein
MSKRGDTGPIRPIHMREALRILQETKKIPGSNSPPSSPLPSHYNPLIRC